MDWSAVSKRRIKTYIYPIRRYWDGFDIRGEKWFIELNNGRVISASDPEYDHWCKKFTREEGQQPWHRHRFETFSPRENNCSAIRSPEVNSYNEPLKEASEGRAKGNKPIQVY